MAEALHRDLCAVVQGFGGKPVPCALERVQRQAFLDTARRLAGR